VPAVDNSVYLASSCNRIGQNWLGQPDIIDSRIGGKLTRTRTGYTNPLWKKQVHDGDNATTNMTGEFCDITESPGVARLSCQAPGSGGTGQVYNLIAHGDLALRRAIGGPPNWTAISAATAYNRGLLAYLKEVRSVNQGFDAPTFLGELKETVRMLRRPLQGMQNFYKDYLDKAKRLKKSKPRSWVSDLSSQWLETMYGIIPLANDVQNFQQAYNSILNKNKSSYVLISKVGVDTRHNAANTFVELLASMIGSLCPVVLHRQRATDKAVVRFRGKVWRQVHATPFDTASYFGFNQSQFVPTAWELLPWSFLYDYFSNIGDVLEAGVTDRSTVAWTNVTEIVFRIREHIVHVAPASAQFGDNPKVGGYASTAVYRRRSVNRYPAAVLGTPELALELPGVWYQWANMAALWQQANAIHPQKPFRRYR
jgi:hypothetical protein